MQSCLSDGFVVVTRLLQTWPAARRCAPSTEDGGGSVYVPPQSWLDDRDAMREITNCSCTRITADWHRNEGLTELSDGFAGRTVPPPSCPLGCALPSVVFTTESLRRFACCNTCGTPAHSQPYTTWMLVGSGRHVHRHCLVSSIVSSLCS